MPEINEDVEVEIAPEDIKMDVYRASGGWAKGEQDLLCGPIDPYPHGNRGVLPGGAQPASEP